MPDNTPIELHRPAFVNLLWLQKDAPAGTLAVLDEFGNRSNLTRESLKILRDKEPVVDYIIKVRDIFHSKQPIYSRSQPFVYDALPSASSIRLLHVEPLLEDGVVRLSMRTYDLDDEDMPAYECLSYTWGCPHANTANDMFYDEKKELYGEDRLWPVLCNGRFLQVRRNLFDALYELRRTRDWHDAKYFKPLSEREMKVSKEQMDALAQMKNEQRNNGSTQLMLAAGEGYEVYFPGMLYTGIDMEERDCEGLTAQDYAARSGHTTISNMIHDKTLQQKARLFWIDCLCINQQDVAERSAQVRMMGRIFERAEQVIVWLGAADALSEQAVESFKKLRRATADGRLGRSKIVPFAPYDQSKAFEEAGIPNFDANDWRALAAVYSRQFFRRIWTLQEVVLAKDIVAYLGPFEVLWDMLLWIAQCFDLLDRASNSNFAANYRFEYMQSTLSEARFICECRTRRLLDAGTEDILVLWSMAQLPSYYQRKGPLYQLPLYDLIRKTSSLKVADPRDRIFGLLGITGDHPESPKITVDYRVPVARLYAELTRAIIKQYGGNRKSIISRLLGCLRHHLNTQIQNLPSWAPDWGFVHVCYLESLASQAAGGQANKHVPVETDAWNQLTVRAIRIDSVAAVGRRRQVPGFMNTFELDPSWFAFAARLKPVYHTGQGRTEVLWRTLCIDQCAAVLSGDGNGESPAPSSYGRQFKDLVCAMILYACDERTLFSMRAPNVEAAIRSMNIARYIDCLKPQGDDRRERIRYYILSRLAEAEIQLAKLEADEDRYTPTWREAIDYIRAPTCRFEEIRSDVNHFGPAYELLGSSETGFWERFKTIYEGRHLHVTEDGFLGLGPETAQRGDEVWVIAGSNSPFVLRPTINDAGQSVYRVIGQAYLHGFMRGEAVTRADGKFETIVLE